MRITPDNYKKIYLDWMYKIHDWCISRQLWWGHRIPAWYCDACGEVIVARQTPTAVPKVRERLIARRCGHARHLVQLRPLALRHAGLAG